jgi:enamine deaminase RidA (YjgF/YER057c/UK114 family)
MMKRHDPPGVAGPFASYSHGVELDEPVRFLFGAGQAGVDADGRIGEGIEEQASLVWLNIGEVLRAADMGIEHLVQLTMLLLHRDDYPAARAVRERVLGEHRPASTLMYVNGLANPEWLIEIDFVAAASA